MSFKKEKLISEVQKISSKFISHELSFEDMVTITSIRMSKDLHKADILITVYPEENEEKVLNYLKRKQGLLARYLKNNSRIGVLPFLTFGIDGGEKNRQRIDELSQKD